MDSGLYQSRSPPARRGLGGEARGHYSRTQGSWAPDTHTHSGQSLEPAPCWVMTLGGPAARAAPNKDKVSAPEGHAQGPPCHSQARPSLAPGANCFQMSGHSPTTHTSTDQLTRANGEPGRVQGFSRWPSYTMGGSTQLLCLNSTATHQTPMHPSKLTYNIASIKWPQLPEQFIRKTTDAQRHELATQTLNHSCH